MLFAMSDAVQITTQICQLIATIATALISAAGVYLGLKLRYGQYKQQDQSAAQAGEIKTALDFKADQIKTALHVADERKDVKLDRIHDLVDGNMSAQMKVAAVALRALATNTHRPEHAQAAEMAEKLYEDHEATQSRSVQRGLDRADDSETP